MPHQLQRAIGDHFVRVHVGGRAGAALEDVEAEFIVQLAVDQLLARRFDSGQHLAVECSAIGVGSSGGHFDHREALIRSG